MSKKKYIAYCTSGLGNRLRPLASALAYCQMTDRELLVYWDVITPNGCLSPLSSLFESQFNLITLDEIANLDGNSVKLFTEKGPGHGVEREASRFGRDQLLKLAQYRQPQHSQSLAMDEESEIVIVYDNDYLSCIPKELSISELRKLNPVKAIRDKVRDIAVDCGIVSQQGTILKTLKSVHARGTDFPIENALEQYVAAIRQSIKSELFFLSTDDLRLEKGIIDIFQKQVLTRHDRMHLKLNEGKMSWYDPDSFTISDSHGIDALTDIYSLSCTDLVVFHPGSTFAEISRHLHHVLFPLV